MDWHFHAVNRHWFCQSQGPLGICQGQKRLPKERLRQRFCRTCGWTFLGASQMTTKFLTIKLVKFPNFIVMEFPKKNSVLGEFSVKFPVPNPLQNAKFINIVVSASLISGEFCLKTLVSLGSALELFRKIFGTVRAFLWLWGSFLALAFGPGVTPVLRPLSRYTVSRTHYRSKFPQF